jgi:transcription elongation factor Elf1
MVKRNNLDKIGGEVDTSAPVSVSGDQLNFAVPTEFVELPSGGMYYPEDHPLYKQETIEIKYMTAKEEDILNSPALLKNGTAVDRMLQNLILDKNIKVSDLLIGDKNALIVSSRISGYGSEYPIKTNCPSCNKPSEIEVLLDQASKFSGATKGGVDKLDDIEISSEGYPLLTMPRSGYKVEIRFLSSKDEVEMTKTEEKLKKHNLPSSVLTNVLKLMVLSVEGNRDRGTIHQFVDTMPAMDSRYIRGVYKIINPTMKLEQDFNCPDCGHDGPLEVPITPTFFWPDQ